MKTRLGGRTWAALLTFGLFGQIAWVIENMYLDVYKRQVPAFADHLSLKSPFKIREVVVSTVKTGAQKLLPGQRSLFHWCFTSSFSGWLHFGFTQIFASKNGSILAPSEAVEKINNSILILITLLSYLWSSNG